MGKRLDLFTIDAENDFCACGDEPADWPWPAGGPQRGALFVDNANKEAVLVAEMIYRLTTQHGSKISKIHSTLDAHHRNDGSHNTAWKLRDGSSPPPFTIVTNAMVKRRSASRDSPSEFSRARSCRPSSGRTSIPKRSKPKAAVSCASGRYTARSASGAATSTIQ